MTLLFRHRLPVRFRDCDPLGHVNNAVYLTYLEQARYGDELEVRLSLAAIGRTSFTYAYDIVEVAGERTVASAKTVQVWFDYTTQRPVPIDDEMRRQLARPVL